MPTVDNLDIQIKSSADSAVRSVDRLADSVGRLAQRLNSFGGNGIKQFSASIGSLASGFNTVSAAVSSFDIAGLKRINKELNSFSTNAEKMSRAAQSINFTQASTGAKAFSDAAKKGADSIARDFGITDAQAVNKLRTQFVELAKALESNSGDVNTIFDQIVKDVWESRNVVNGFAREYEDVIRSIQAANKSGAKITMPFSSSEFTDDFSQMRKMLGKAFTSTEDIANQNTIGFDAWFAGLDDATVRTVTAEMERLGLNTNSAASAFQALVSIKQRYNEATRAGAVAETEANSSMQAAQNSVMSTIDRFMELERVFGRVSDIGRGQTANAFDTIANELNKLGAVSLPNAEQLTGVASAISRLGRVDTSGLQNANFGRMGEEVRRFSEAVSSIGAAPESLSNLINSITRLSRNAQGADAASVALPKLSAALNDFSASISGIGGVSENVTNLLNAISKLTRIGKQSDEISAGLDNLGQSLKRFMREMSSAPAINDSVVRMTEAVGNLRNSTVSLGNTMGNSTSRGTSLFSNGLKTVGSWLVNGVKRILTFNGALNRFIPGMRKAEDSTNGFVSKIGMFYAKFFLLIRAFKMIGKVVEDAMDSIEVVNYFNAAVDQVTKRADLSKWQELGYDSAESYANSFKEGMLKTTEQMSGYTLNAAGNLVQSGMKNFGIDSSILMNYQAQFAQMASSIGVSSEYSTKISRAMTEIGADLASVKNMDFKDVWDNLSSGLTGMSRAVDKYGINIRNAALQTELSNLGINANVQALSQADKAMLRTIVILNSSEYAWGDLADRNRLVA